MEQDQGNTQELPSYKCYKKVGALKIEEVLVLTDGSGTLKPAGPLYPQFMVSKEYMDKHDPKAGGYYVRYDDGYESFSPAAAFESGYSRIP